MVSTSGTVIVDACLAFLGIVVEGFATVSRPNAVDVHEA